MLLRFAAASAAALLLAGAASAQPADTPAATAAPAEAPAPPPAPAPAAEPAQAPVTGYNAKADSSAFPGAEVATAKAGDPGIVSNGPVADTPENREKYGMPDSRKGKRTRPAGN